MQCPCGDETRIGVHEVKTLSKAQEWCQAATEADLPIMVEQERCPACGRQQSTISNESGLFERKG